MKLCQDVIISSVVADKHPVAWLRGASLGAYQIKHLEKHLEQEDIYTVNAANLRALSGGVRSSKVHFADLHSSPNTSEGLTLKATLVWAGKLRNGPSKEISFPGNVGALVP